MRIVEGAPLKLRCNFTGVPQPSLKWLFNRSPLQDDTIIRTENALLILQFERRHQGDYKCIAENVLGMASAWSDVKSQCEFIYLIQLA